jgi:DNA-binding MarR family transcriptional regulator
MAMSGEPAPISDAVVNALMRASRALGDINARSLASANEDVTLPQFRTLLVLATRGPQTVTALADQLDVHASTMTRMCTRLVTRGLVVRVPSAIDRREVVITLSNTGTTLVDDVLTNRRREFDTIAQKLSDSEQHAVIDALHTFATACGDDPSSDTTARFLPDDHMFMPEEDK